jgi:DHA2 family multidrug resistance protein-like MFS transporter
LLRGCWGPFWECYTLGATIFILLLNVFFSRTWFGDAEARGLIDQQAHPALDVVTQVTASSPIVGPTTLTWCSSPWRLRADYSAGVMVTMLTITVVPLVVAALAYFLIPRRPEQTPPQASPAGGQEAKQPGPAP